MLIKIILFLTILLYSIIVSQSFSYIISLRNVQLNMNAGEYISFRKLTDKNFQKKFKYVMYAGLLLNLLLLVLCTVQFSAVLFASSLTGFIALVADTIIAVKKNMPINKIINTWTAEKYPGNWAGYRTVWLFAFSQRQCLNITGFFSLLAGAIFS